MDKDIFRDEMYLIIYVINSSCNAFMFNSIDGFLLFGHAWT